MNDAWSQRLRALLDEENPQIALRASRGRAYERAGRVTDVRPVAGALSARVQGSRATPYAVEIGMPVLDEAEWYTVSSTVVEQVRHGARLLAGQVPAGLVEELEARGVRLFPHPAELELRCGCDDPAPQCKHMAAVIESAARRLDEDPFLLLRLRGRGRERLLADLAAARRAVRREDEGEPVGDLSLEGWAIAPVPLEGVAARVAVAEPPLSRRGDPPGWAGGVAAADLFGPLLERGAEWVAARPLRDTAGERPDRDTSSEGGGQS
ncbi:MAG: hypothetical protein GEU81_15775 [Nitriliruptorales bacterium]|nr:hypothetical protein [Nitriliruptorales bacterium]